MASEVTEIPRSQREERLSTRLSTTLGKDGELPEVTVSGAALPPPHAQHASSAVHGVMNGYSASPVYPFLTCSA